VLRQYRLGGVSDSARWEGFQFRGDDIVISTPPKCGTTWMQMICALLVFRGPALPARLTELSPWLDMETNTVENVSAALEAQQHRRFIKTHTPLDGLPSDDRVTYVCVGRDPRDAAISWDNHRNNSNPEKILGACARVAGPPDPATFSADGAPPEAEDAVERFWCWVYDDGGPDVAVPCLKYVLHHLGTFWDRRQAANVVLFHYADLLVDLDGEMRRLAAVLGIEIEEDTWPALVSEARFDRMRDRAEELAPEVTIDGAWKDVRRFFNNGSAGQWRSFLSPEGLARYKERVLQLSTPDLAAWAHSGWGGVTRPVDRVRPDPDG
jgi:aryl sulfotransferase